MDKHPLKESLWRRGWNDTKNIWTSWPFYILDAVVAVVIGGVFGWYWGLAIVIFGTICVWMGATARAPVKQRDEARELVEQQRKPSDSEVADTIRLLETETLVLKNNEEEERSYSFAQVFSAIADQLTIGVSLNGFGGRIQEALDLDANEGWFIPNKIITHLFGVLDQNALVDRHNEEYQRMVGGLTDAFTAYTYPQPKEHLSKGTVTKYYLSPLGRRVIQQLRQQSTAHKKDSQPG